MKGKQKRRRFHSQNGRLGTFDKVTGKYHVFLCGSTRVDTESSPLFRDSEVWYLFQASFIHHVVGTVHLHHHPVAGICSTTVCAHLIHTNPSWHHH